MEQTCITVPILYSFRRCPYAMRARMALYYAGIVVEHREIALKNKPGAMLEASPKGTVPVLVMPDGAIMEESLDIMEWALGQNDPEGWLGADGEESEFLIDRNDHQFKQALDRYKYPNRYPDEDCSKAQSLCEVILQDLETRLGNHKQLCGDHVTQADIALFPFIRQCAFTEKDWFDALPLPRLQHWLAAHIGSGLFQTIMEKHDLWKAGDEPVYSGRAAV